MVKPAMSPSIESGWGKDYSNTTKIKGFAYDQETSFLYTHTYFTEQFNIFLNVPQSIASQMVYLQSAPSPDTFYDTIIISSFPQCLLTEACTQLITEDGKFLVI